MRAPIVMGAVLGSGCASILNLDEVAPVDPCALPDRTGDEDGDSFPDGCDVCPADPTLPADGDIDADGVGDACDPDTVNAHRLVEFDGFTTPLAWTPADATWTFTGGNYEVSGPSPSRSELVVPLADHPRVDALFQGQGLASVDMVIGAGAVVARCALVPVSSGSGDQLVLTVGMATAMKTLDSGAGAGRLRLGIDETGNFYCLGKRSSVEATTQLSAPGTGATTSRIGLLGQTIQFASVAVFGRQ